MMLRLLVVLNILYIFVIFKTNAAKILCVFPTPSYSHQIVHRSLTQELVRRGHDLVVITSHPAYPTGNSPTNLREIDMYNATYQIWNDGIIQVYNAISNEINITNIYLSMLTKIVEKQLQSEPVRELIKNERNSFDLLLLESNVPSTLALTHVFDVPVISMSTFGPMPWTYSTFGTFNHPLLYPTTLLQQRFYNLTTWESIHNMYKNFMSTYAMYSYEKEDNKMLQRNLGMDILPMSKLYERISVYLQTVYPIWMSNPPVPPGIVYLGGLHQKGGNNLTQELQTFLDSSTNGVIYVSFGTNVHPSLLSQEKIDMMAKVFSNLPYEVLWKRDENVQSNTTQNVKISTWFPQSDLLYHPKVILFITQGGLQSTEESITAGVPLIGIPMYGDQWMHTENYERTRIGLKLTWSTLSEDEFRSAIASVIGDKRYKENVIRLRNIMNDQPLTPMERAVWWTEYVLRHGGARHLLPASANMTWVQYFEVELVVIVLLFLITIFSVLIFMTCTLVRSIFKKVAPFKETKVL